MTKAKRTTFNYIDALQSASDSFARSLESLPAELQRNFKLMRDLDGRAQHVIQEVDQLGEEFLRTSSSATGDRKKELTAKITKFFNKAKEYGDDKVQLAIQTYELVDKHIRRLDSDLARFESEIKNGTVNSTTADADSTSKAKVKRGRKREKEPSTSTNKKQKTVEVEEKAGASKGKSGGGGGGKSPARKKHKSEIQLVAEQAASIVGSGEVLDMPVDPNEPTYCICHQVSYGEMIACDNPECPIEWFHITCMGLNSIPKGKWFCPKCQPLVVCKK